MSIKNASKTPKRIVDTSKPKKIDPDKVAKTLGAEKVEGTPKVKGDPIREAKDLMKLYRDIKKGKYDKKD